MKCPICRSELVREFYGGKIVFRCPGCDGRMMTVSGFRSLCRSRNFVNMLWQTARYGDSDPGPVCASCGKAMRKVALPLAGAALELDICCSCRLVWFDPGELKQIPLPEPEKKDELPQKAKELLAMRKIGTEEERLSAAFVRGGFGEYGDDTPEESWKYIPALLGMPVELDAPGCDRKPFVTWGIALVCVAVFALTFKNLSGAADSWGFVPALWTRHGGLTIVTSMFLHGGIFHLIGNLYFLLIFGDNVEDEFGWRKYVLLLVASGLCATLLHGLFDPRTTIPCIGASGFISGVIAGYAFCFPSVRLSFLLPPRKGIFSFMRTARWSSVPAWLAFVFWLALQMIMAKESRTSTPGDGVAWLAHVGGALPGVLFAIYIRAKRLS